MALALDLGFDFIGTPTAIPTPEEALKRLTDKYLGCKATRETFNALQMDLLSLMRQYPNAAWVKAATEDGVGSYRSFGVSQAKPDHGL